MALSNAARQRRYRARRNAAPRRVQFRRPHDRRSRPQRWQDAVRTLRDLQDEYQAWLDHLPDPLRESVAVKLEAICDLDLADLESIEHRAAARLQTRLTPRVTPALPHA